MRPCLPRAPGGHASYLAVGELSVYRGSIGLGPFLLRKGAALTNQDRFAARRVEIGQERRARTRARIIAAAFELLGDESGLYTRVEDIADRAGITRPTFYNHFSGMTELREAVTYEVTHEFLIAVSYTVSFLDDPRERASAAIRFYLERVQHDARWGWSMINLSASGLIFGAETFRQAETTVQDGISSGQLVLPSSTVGRDIIMGSSLAAISTLLRFDPGPEYLLDMVEAILIGMGTPHEAAADIARRPLPLLVTPPETGT